MALDYFRFTSNTASFVKQAEEMFGKSNELKITFLSNDDNINCIQRYELRDGANLVAYTDLENLWTSETQGFVPVEQSRIAKAGGIDACMKALEEKHKAAFYEMCTLRFVLMGFPVVGVWELTTKGKKSSVTNIINAYDFVKASAGRVFGMPFRLTVAKVKSNRYLKKANGQKEIRQYPVVSLLPDISPEMQEQVPELGAKLSGLITTTKIERIAEAATDNVPALAAPNTPNGESQYTKYEEV